LYFQVSKLTALRGGHTKEDDMTVIIRSKLN